MNSAGPETPSTDSVVQPLSVPAWPDGEEQASQTVLGDKDALEGRAVLVSLAVCFTYLHILSLFLFFLTQGSSPPRPFLHPDHGTFVTNRGFDGSDEDKRK